MPRPKVMMRNGGRKYSRPGCSLSHPTSVAGTPLKFHSLSFVPYYIDYSITRRRKDPLKSEIEESEMMLM
jgi:hypothetical protein